MDVVILNVWEVVAVKKFTHRENVYFTGILFCVVSVLAENNFKETIILLYWQILMSVG